MKLMAYFQDLRGMDGIHLEPPPSSCHSSDARHDLSPDVQNLINRSVRISPRNDIALDKEGLP